MCRIITRSELQNKTSIELSGLFQKVSQQLADTKPGSPEQCCALANLDNIKQVQSLSLPRPKSPGF